MDPKEVLAVIRQGRRVLLFCVLAMTKWPGGSVVCIAAKMYCLISLRKPLGALVLNGYVSVYGVMPLTKRPRGSVGCQRIGPVRRVLICDD